MDKIEKVMIVCDPGMVEFGYTKTVENCIRQRTEQPQIKIFSEVNRTHQRIQEGLEMNPSIQPDTIALGGSAMDAAKARGCSLNTLRHHSC